MSCDICKCKDTYVKEYNHSYIIKNEKVEFKKLRRFCSNCNHLVYDKELDNEASKEAIRIYNKIVGVSPEDIITLRKNLNLTQFEFAKIIGCAKKTLISYELGKSIPNDSYLVTLKTLIENPDIIVNMMESTKERFEEEEYNKIYNKIAIYLDNNSKQILFNENVEPTIYNGFTLISLEKIKGVISILAQNTILKTKLLKELFYIDFFAYKNTGASITGLEYAKLKYGPVPNEFEILLQKLVTEKIINYTIVYNENYESHEITCTLDDISSLSGEEIKIVESVKQFFETFNCQKIVEYSHQEKAFTETNLFEKISYDYAFDLKDLEN